MQIPWGKITLVFSRPRDCINRLPASYHFPSPWSVSDAGDERGEEEDDDRERAQGGQLLPPPHHQVRVPHFSSTAKTRAQFREGGGWDYEKVSGLTQTLFRITSKTELKWFYSLKYSTVLSMNKKSLHGRADMLTTIHATSLVTSQV